LLTRALGLHPVIASVVAHRGYSEPSAASEFLSPKLETLHDPFLMRDMASAVARLEHAIKTREPILLYGDYDVDGTASIVVLKKAIELLGGCAAFHVPHRLKEGYGMRSEIIDQASARGVRLIVSVDTGIRANAVVAHACELGIDVILTDHHLPEQDLPPALAVLNPNRRDCLYPDKNLCGAGVALKLVQALLGRSGIPPARQLALLDSFLKPVAIATVADIVPLTAENRIIVRRGLSGLSNARNHGLRALLAVAGFDAGECPSAHQVAFRLAPRINAAGRMATALAVIELFLTEDAARAGEIAAELDRLNRERQRIEAEIAEIILGQIEEEGFDPACPALVFAGPGWHLGVLGIVASRLVERFHRPVFVLSETADLAGEPCFTGSGRSIPDFHLLEALESMPELFQKFGGHRQAAGLTLAAAQLASFRERFTEFAATRLGPDNLRPLHAIDAEASFTDIDDRSLEQLQRLGPFGFGNPLPIFYARGAEVAAPPKALKDGKHLTVPLRQNGRLLFCKAWNFGDRAAEFTPGAKLDILYQIEEDPTAARRGWAPWTVSLKDVREYV